MRVGRPGLWGGIIGREDVIGFTYRYDIRMCV